MKHLLLISLLFISTIVSYSQDVKIKNNVFETLYSQSLEQPLWIRYRSTNRPTNVNRGTMDFYKEPNVKTSDADDYAKNIYDKGHGAPAASFSDNMENLKQTFSYLNCILQDQYLNRGEWRLLEEQERRWDDTENLTVLITLHFDNPVKRIPTNAAIPSYLEKHIYFESQKKWKCFVFLNEKPKFKWEQLEKLCEPNEHNK
ncbi:DNA/RNA non-specific endonuclease [archaeon]|nr:DNA/RNA non-specific endonuclease [archaeon]